MTFDPSRYRAPERVDLPDRRWPNRALDRAPTWCSVDLRDGNQALPDPMGHDRKRALLQLLLAVGFEQIELGFPSASQTDFDFIRWCIESGVLGERVIPQVITQAREPLIARTFESIVGAKRAIVHLYNSTSELQRRVVFNKSRSEILDLAVQGTRWVKAQAEALHGTEVTFQYSPESFTGTELDYALEVCEAVVEAWDPSPERKLILNLPTTVEMTTPNVYADRIEWFDRHLKRRDSVILSLHTHNDRGTGVACAELGLLAGATRVEGTLLGNGERSGNVDIVTLALNLYSHGVDPGLVFEDLPALVRIVEETTKLPVHPRHPYAGELVFTAFSGSHQDAIHKGQKAMEASDGRLYEVPYLPIDPADVGRGYEPVIRINSQSGKSGIAHVLERDFGLRLPRALAIELSREVQARTDASGEEYSAEATLGLFRQLYVDVAGPLAFESAAVQRQSDGSRCKVVTQLQHLGKPVSAQGVGAGPIEAFVNALSQCLGSALTLGDYSEHAVGEGAAAQATAYVSLRTPSAPQARFGASAHEDVVLASFRAIVSAYNRSIL